MKLWLLNQDKTFKFEYDVPKGAEGENLIPSVPYAETSPPAVSDNQIAVYEDGKWYIKDDFRGVRYWIDNESSVINDIDELVPAGASLTPPPSKAELLAAITVTTQSGKTFDGNETARTDILSALTAGELIGATSTNWKLADNTVAIVTRDELLEALSLAIQEKGRIVGAID